ncbi:HEPN/Toprim-associated domain-containing protein [Paraburkholderia sp. BL17N1]|uniref:HEPN/Toprim-associated domain-containing protein n=1 Tax=Paraburkholderia sp. BL17N1 TaxID=1938798 RepID=UPI000F1ECD88|nr:HEPN/Toprim-associated domain-containing protein [Paraburkholderia sp. BL17N1]RKR36195.1 hypothetical protein B0G82_4228 [Paraburkholderia sp. BL17N1]
MTCSSKILIGGYELDEMRRSYTVWERFEKKDRVIRSPKYPLRWDMPDGEQRMTLKFAYSVTADVLRRRLGRAGFTRTTLEQEFQQYYEAVCQQSGTLFFDTYLDSKKAQARADAFRAATLDDWLEALAKAVKARVTRVRRNAREAAHPDDILVDIITGSDAPDEPNLMPKHSLLGFPCSSLDNMAVALLEVVDGDAQCEQDVSMFVEFLDDTTFDDMRLRQKQPAQGVVHDECDI